MIDLGYGVGDGVGGLVGVGGTKVGLTVGWIGAMRAVGLAVAVGRTGVRSTMGLTVVAEAGGTGWPGSLVRGAVAQLTKANRRTQARMILHLLEDMLLSPAPKE